MRWIIPSLVATTMALGGLQANEAEPAGRKALEEYVATLAGERGEAGKFLLEHLPAADGESLTVGLFRENLEEAFAAREKYPWAKALDRELFFNEVLPHAVVNETRDPWRKQLRELFDPLLADSRNVRDAATVIGSRIAELTGVKYDTKREKACQSPAESMRQHMASCTGLSILMVDALRACGVPARLAGIPMWGSLEGNHTWVEIHDGTDWHLSGYGGTPDGWNKGWEIDRCAYCDPEKPFHGVFASSYRKTAVGFPMIWDWKIDTPPNSENVCVQERDAAGRLIKLGWKFQPTAISGVDRTARYIELAGGRKTVIPKGMAAVAIRAYLTDGKSRVDVAVRASRDGTRIFEGRTASEAQDLNDFVRITCPPGPLKIEYRKADGAWAATEVQAATDAETPVKLEISPQDAAGVLSIDQRRSLATWFRSGGAAWPTNIKWPELKDAATTRAIQDELWSIYREAKRLDPASKELGSLPRSLAEMAAASPDGKAVLTPGRLTLGKHQMPFILIRKELAPVPQSGRAMFICLHGGGGNGEVPG
ncbi:MAG TPA: transglutaminase domain-containing protein, partial [Luteolibacter sp.]